MLKTCNDEKNNALLLIFSTNFFLNVYDIIGKETCTCLEAKNLDYTKLNKKICKPKWDCV
jgi:hypothetical protein